MAILNVPIQVRVDNEQNWDNSTLILKDGEPALCKKEDGTQELKFGDGQKTYKELSPFGGNKVEENSGDLLVTLTSIEDNQASATYGQIKATINSKHLVAVIYEEQVYILDKVQSNGTIEFRLDNSQGQKYLGISSSGVWYENSSSWQAVNISIDEIKGLEATNVQDALAELKEDGVQLNDNAINTTEAWSSKKIVDTLCPPFSLSGNPVTCHPVEGYPLSAVVTLKPKQAGSGDPSPDNVRPITGWDSVQVTRCGKNLLDYAQLTAAIIAYGLTSEKIGDNIIRVSGVATKTGASLSFLVCYSAQTSLQGKGYTIFAMPISGAEKLKSAYGLRTAGERSIAIVAELVKNTSYDMRFQLMITADNSTPAAYEPYQGNDYTLTLPETIYGGTVDAVTGAGSKTWGFIASYSGESLPGEWISDRDVYSAGTTPTTGAQVAYKLATPEPFQATGNQPLPAVAGLNTVYTDGDSLAVSGRSDPTAYIQQQISDAITAAVAITGGT